MLLHCPRVQALFPQEHIRLEHDGPAWMHWTEHGGTLILKVGDLKFGEIDEPGEESGFFLEVEMIPHETLVHKIEGFATKHNLILPPIDSSAPSCSVQPILAACHIPGQKKIIFAEESRLEARPGKAGTVEIAVQGEFRARPVPCQEADMVIHLTPYDLAQLLSYLRTLARAQG
ncbi:MAG: hypothetical protein HY790_00925 [Deltaproteobacteria bacterium]|nr:hypothetical protein [Deltaproteobacteria bacterium]